MKDFWDRSKTWVKYTSDDIRKGDAKEIAEDLLQGLTGTTDPLEALDKILMATVPFAVPYLGTAGKVVSSEGATSKGATSFFEGTQYTPKVLKQMAGEAGEFHSFPEAVRAFEGSGTVRAVTGGDGVTRSMLEIPGSYLSDGGTWYNGVFQFMKEANGDINHRFFQLFKP
jgi:hypothetical protein